MHNMFWLLTESDGKIQFDEDDYDGKGPYGPGNHDESDDGNYDESDGSHQVNWFWYRRPKAFHLQQEYGKLLAALAGVPEVKWSWSWDCQDKRSWSWHPVRVRSLPRNWWIETDWVQNDKSCIRSERYDYRHQPNETTQDYLKRVHKALTDRLDIMTHGQRKYKTLPVEWFKDLWNSSEKGEINLHRWSKVIRGRSDYWKWLCYNGSKIDPPINETAATNLFISEGWRAVGKDDLSSWQYLKSQQGLDKSRRKEEQKKRRQEKWHPYYNSHNYRYSNHSV